MYSAIPMKPHDGAAMPQRRKRVNLLAIIVNVILPWLVFSALYAMFSFNIHYEEPGWVALAVAVGLGLSFLAAFLGYRSWLREQEPMWCNFAAVTILLAVLLAIAVGLTNYHFNMGFHYSYEHLNAYPSIDPAAVKGQEVVDAGRVYFVNGTVLDTSKAIGHKDSVLYCVAPIVTGTEKLPSYDFWAVGMDCCSGIAGDFKCGQFNNLHARAGLRMINERERGHYLSAVWQAEGAYRLAANFPIFFYWTQDPDAEIAAYLTAGYNWFYAGVCTHFVVMLFCVMFAVARYAKGTAKAP